MPHPSIDERVESLENAVSTLGLWAGGTTPPWYAVVSAEPGVNIAIRDLCKAGDVGFDVGSHVGAMAILMSRAVGLRGSVLAFEASPRNIPQLQRNLIQSHCANVQLIHAAIHATSDIEVPIYYNPISAADSLRSFDGTEGAHVRGLALDDFVAETGFVPNLIKMDIEGAEYDALQGLLKTIRTHRPPLLLEQFPSEHRCWDLLSAEGYFARDVDTLQLYDGARKGAEDRTRNLLYVHPANPTDTHYDRENWSFEDALASEKFEQNKERSELVLGELNAGRYVATFHYSRQATNADEVELGIMLDDRPFVMYKGPLEVLIRNFSSAPFNLEKQKHVRFWWSDNASVLPDAVTVVRLINPRAFRSRGRLGEGTFIPF